MKIILLYILLLYFISTTYALCAMFGKFRLLFKDKEKEAAAEEVDTLADGAGLRDVQHRVDEIIAQRREKLAEYAGYSVKMRYSSRYQKDSSGKMFEISWGSIPLGNPLLLLNYESKRHECFSEGKLWVESLTMKEDKVNDQLYTGCVVKEDEIYARDGWGVLESLLPFYLKKDIKEKINEKLLPFSSDYIYVGTWRKNEPHGIGRMHLFEEFQYKMYNRVERKSKFVWASSFVGKFESKYDFTIVKTIAETSAKDFVFLVKNLALKSWTHKKNYYLN